MVFKIQYTDAELERMLEDEHSCVEIEKGVKRIGIHPFYLGNLSNGINQTLNKMILQFDKGLNGIILMYKNPKASEEPGAISTNGHMYTDVEAEFYLFRPEVNKICKGIVTKTSKDHVGCLVNKAFNVSIPKNPEDSKWKGAKVRVGDEILLKITFTDLFYIIPYIRGEIINITLQKAGELDSGVSTSEDVKTEKQKKSFVKNVVKVEQEESEVKKTSKKKKCQNLDVSEDIKIKTETPKNKKQEDGESSVHITKAESSKKKKRKSELLEETPKKRKDHLQCTPEEILAKILNSRNGDEEESAIQKTKKKKRHPETPIEEVTPNLKKESRKSKKQEQENQEEVKTKTPKKQEIANLEVKTPKTKKQENTDLVKTPSRKRKAEQENPSSTKKIKKEDDIEDLRNSLLLSVLNSV